MSHAQIMGVNLSFTFYMQFLFHFSDDFEKNTPISLVSATDIDSGENGILSYNISTTGNGSSYLTIDNNNGLVSTKVIPNTDRQTMQNKLFVVYVEVRDNGQSSRTSTATITYIVTAAAKTFEFTKNYITTNVLEHSTTGTVIIRLSDDINPTDAQVNYEIPGIDNFLNFNFTLNSTTGEISLTGSIDRETKDEYIFAARAVSKDGTASALVLVSNTIQYTIK